jgi:PIN domain
MRWNRDDSREEVHLLGPGASHWKIFVDLCRRSDARGNLVPDAFHAALAIELGCEWLTLDRGFARFPGLKWRHPSDWVFWRSQRAATNYGWHSRRYTQMFGEGAELEAAK